VVSELPKGGRGSLLEVDPGIFLRAGAISDHRPPKKGWRGSSSRTVDSSALIGGHGLRLLSSSRGPKGEHELLSLGWRWWVLLVVPAFVGL